MTLQLDDLYCDGGRVDTYFVEKGGVRGENLNNKGGGGGGGGVR